MSRAQEERVARVWAAVSDLVFREDRRRVVAEELGMSFFRTKILRRLLPGATTMRDLATRLGADKAYLSVAVDDLERRGLVERSVHPDDRRVRLLTLTKAGATAARRANELLAQPPESLRTLPSDDLAALERILDRVLGDHP